MEFALSRFADSLFHGMFKRSSSPLPTGPLVVLASLAVTLLQCGAPAPPAADGNHSSGGSESSGGSDSATGGSGDGGSGLQVPGAGGAPELDPDEACAIGSEQATLRPATMLILFDRSSSLIRNEVEPGVTRWQAASSAFAAFLSDPSTDGLGVALRFFPHDLPAEGCNTPTCDIAACSQPLIDMGRLLAAQGPDDAHEAALLAALAEATPVTGGGTPTGAILEGGIDWALAYQDEHQDERVVILLVTDGAPEGCEERIPYLEDYLKEALDGGISTYIVGLTGENGEELAQDSMNYLADAGGTDEALFIQDGQATQAELLQALASVQGSAIACDFELPKVSHGGEEIDPGLVNVIYTSGSSSSEGAETTFTKVARKDECGDSASWFYDVEDAPTSIHLCPGACESVSADPAASVEILLGCKPIVR
jgi:hypothetical protein